jgi:mono/diheme cytochrome c family protein
MKTLSALLLLLALLLAGCGAGPTDTPQPVAPTSTPLPTAEAPAATTPAREPAPSPTPEAEVPPAPSGEGRALPTEKGALFSASGLCTSCHTAMVDESGTDVSTDRLWRSTMMANAARDPYWLASVRAETLVHPDYQAVIEDKCVTCHTPMARFTAITEGEEGSLFGAGFLSPGNQLHALALDGVSCNLCHQIRDVAFGEFGSFSGHFVIDSELPMGERVAFGPYPVLPDLVSIMQASSGFVPVESAHIEQSELCATCHTLYTPYVDDEGKIAGEFPEQTPYLEWLQSDFVRARSCQGCHMPQADGGVQLSITGGPQRSPFYQHVFVGGNAYMLGVLERFGDELGVTATQDQFQEKQASTVEQLQSRTASLALRDVSLADSQLSVTVAIGTFTGHKFPTGFPSRRAWVHLAVKDAGGNLVFESGAVDADGSISGDDHDADPARFEPHYVTIESADQVQIYESVMRDPNGDVTTILLRGAGYIKDNRLLPSGFDKADVDADIAVYGAAVEDEDFSGGGDRVQYQIDIGDSQGPFTIEAELLYQAVSYRWAQKLQPFDAKEPQAFLRYYGSVENQPVVVAADMAEAR